MSLPIDYDDAYDDIYEDEDYDPYYDEYWGDDYDYIDDDYNDW